MPSLPAGTQGQGQGAVAPQSRYINPANPTPFEATPGELVSEEIDLQSLSEKERKNLDRNQKAESLWNNADYRDYDKSFTELYKLSRSFANNKYRLALSSYQAGVNSIIKMRDAVENFRKDNETAKHMGEKWYWQVIDRKAQEERVIRRMQRKAKIDAVTYFTRGVNHLDEIASSSLREKIAFKRLLSNIYRNWILYQFDLGNIPQCTRMLELYIQIDNNEKEYPAHKYLSQSYAFQENLVLKYGKNANESDLLRFRYKKNVHLLRATELKYGKESVEYKHIVNLVNRDDIISLQN